MASVGQTVRFSVQVSGVPKPEVCWYKDPQILLASKPCCVRLFHDDEDYNLMLLDLLSEDGGTYSCEAKNDYGVATSSALLTVEGVYAFIIGCDWMVFTPPPNAHVTLMFMSGIHS